MRRGGSLPTGERVRTLRLRRRPVLGQDASGFAAPAERRRTPFRTDRSGTSCYSDVGEGRNAVVVVVVVVGAFGPVCRGDWTVAAAAVVLGTDCGDHEDSAIRRRSGAKTRRRRSPFLVRIERRKATRVRSAATSRTKRGWSNMRRMPRDYADGVVILLPLLGCYTVGGGGEVAYEEERGTREAKGDCSGDRLGRARE